MYSVEWPIWWMYDDGRRQQAGYKGGARDCVVRAIAIAAELPYETVYGTINEIAKFEKVRPGQNKSSARTGVHKATIKRYLTHLGWTWTPTMKIGSGCKVHLRRDELPEGRLIVSVSKHLVAVIDGVIHDTHDPSRNGTRCVYGFWSK